MDLKEEVKSKLSIIDVVSHYGVELQNPSSASPKARCPFHEERTPSFSVSVEHDSWRCWGACAIGGDIFNFVMRAEGVDFSQALDILCKQAGIERKSNRDDSRQDQATEKAPTEPLYKINQIAEDFFHRQLQGSQGKEALEYLESRGIDQATAQRRGIGFAPDGINSLLEYLKSVKASSGAAVKAGLLVRWEDGTWHDMFSNRITISIRDSRNRIIGFGARAMGDAQPKYLNTSATSIFEKSQALYGIQWAAEAIKASGRAIVVEGYMDVIAAHENGFKNTVASMGTAITSHQLEELSRMLPSDQSEQSIVLCLDSDDAGQTATINAIRNAIPRFRNNSRSHDIASADIPITVAKPVISENGKAKDPDEAIRQNPAQWMQSIDQSVHVIDFIIDAHMSRHDIETTKGQDAVISEIGPYFLLPPSTIAARRLLENIANRLGIEYDQLVGILAAKQSVRIKDSKRQTAAGSRFARQRNSKPPKRSSLPPTYHPNPWEHILMACLVQYDYAIEHAQFLLPKHFKDEQLGKLFKLMQQAALSAASEDPNISRLVQELQTTPLFPENGASIPDQAAVIKITHDCAIRTCREHLQREKEREASQARENGNEIPSDQIHYAIQNNEQIKQLHSTRFAT